MAATFLDSKICRYIRPDSVTNSLAELYEYYIVWLGVDGGVYCWLFEDFTQDQKIDGDIINQKTDNISKIFKSSQKTISVIAENLTENEFDVISDITRALVIYRYFKDGTRQKISILTDSIEKPKSQFRYNLQLEFMEQENRLMK